jgi:hypothetical protein
VSPTIRCLDFRPHERSTLRGFCALELPAGGLVVKDVSLHERNGERWLSLPARSYTDKDGNRQFADIITFANADAKRSFQAAALAAVDAYLKGNHHEQAPDPYP